MRHQKGVAGPGPINSDGTTLNPSSFWHTGMDRALADKMQQRMAQDTYSRIKACIELISNSNASQNSIPVLAAKYEMAQRFRYGWGVNPNDGEALKFYKLAAKGGHPQAGYKLARLYVQGNATMGIEKDLAKAKEIINSTISAYNRLDENVKNSFSQEKNKKQLENLGSVVDCYQNNITIGF